MIFNRLKKNQPASIEIEKYLILLENLKDLLLRNNHLDQSRIMQNLTELILHNQNDLFIKNLNSIDIWGGSGAVWEVNIGDKSDQFLFQTEIVKLINLMEEDKILGRGIKPIRKIFIKEMKKG